MHVFFRMPLDVEYVQNMKKKIQYNFICTKIPQIMLTILTDIDLLTSYPKSPVANRSNFDGVISGIIERAKIRRSIVIVTMTVDWTGISGIRKLF